MVQENVLEVRNKMRFAIETEGVLGADDEVLDRPALERIFDTVAEALSQLNTLEADVGINFATAELEFYVVVEADDSRAAYSAANAVVDAALATAGVAVRWAEAHTRRAELTPA